MLKVMIFKCFLALLMIMVLSVNTCLAGVKFTKNCEKEAINLIKNSTQTIDIAVYSINNLNIIEALIRAKERGVEIRILTDRLQAFGTSSKVKLLHDIGFDIKVHSVDRIMHHKFAIFDNQKVIEGSFNWTNSAATKNAEDCNIFEKEEDILTLNKRFKQLWNKNKKNTSECYFDNMKVEKSKRVKC